MVDNKDPQQLYSKEEVDLIRLDDKLVNISNKCNMLMEVIKNDLAQKHEIDTLRKDVNHLRASLSRQRWATKTFMGARDNAWKLCTWFSGMGYSTYWGIRYGTIGYGF